MIFCFLLWSLQVFVLPETCFSPLLLHLQHCHWTLLLRLWEFVSDLLHEIVLTKITDFLAGKFGSVVNPYVFLGSAGSEPVRPHSLNWGCAAWGQGLECGLTATSQTHPPTQAGPLSVYSRKNIPPSTLFTTTVQPSFYYMLRPIATCLETKNTENRRCKMNFWLFGLSLRNGQALWIY